MVEHHEIGYFCPTPRKGVPLQKYPTSVTKT